MSQELSQVDTEYILEHFNDLTDGPFAELASALRDLKAMPETLAPLEPPLYPSAVLKNVTPFVRSTRRTVLTAVAVTAIAVSTTLGAAALTGFGPKPLVNFAKSTFKAIGRVGGDVVNVVKAVTPFIAANTNSDATPQVLPEPTEISDETDQQTNGDQNTITNVSDQGENQKPTTHDPKVEASTESHVEDIVKAPEKPEVKATEVPEVKVSEKPEVKVSEKPEVKVSEKPEVKVSEKPEPKPSPEAKQTPQSVESNETSGEKDN